MRNSLLEEVSHLTKLIANNLQKCMISFDNEIIAIENLMAETERTSKIRNDSMLYLDKTLAANQILYYLKIINSFGGLNVSQEKTPVDIHSFVKQIGFISISENENYKNSKDQEIKLLKEKLLEIESNRLTCIICGKSYDSEIMNKMPCGCIACPPHRFTYQNIGGGYIACMRGRCGKVRKIRETEWR